MKVEYDEDLLERMKEVKNNQIYENREVYSRATEQYLTGRREDAEWIKENFSQLVEDIEDYAYGVYLNSEREAGSQAIVGVFRDLLDEGAEVEEFLDLLEEHFHLLDRFYMSLSQSRKARSGDAFQYIVDELFTLIGYPFTARPEIDGRPDYVLPSVDHYRKHPLDCVIFTLKRTLRERWRQIVTEGRKARGFFLATIDEDVGEGDLRDMMESKIYLVVPRRMEDEIDRYQQAPNVVSFEQFFRRYLDPAMARWEEAGLV